MLFTSDAPIESNNPLIGLQALVTRCYAGGMPVGGWFSKQKLTLEEAHDGYTRISAWTSLSRRDFGALKPGMIADLTVFEQDLNVVLKEKTAEVKVKATLVAGELVLGGLGNCMAED